jgi:hypothetical protein
MYDLENEGIDELESLREFFSFRKYQSMVLFRNQIDSYVSNPLNWTKSGLETKKRDVIRYINKLIINSLDPDTSITHDLEEFAILNNEIVMFKRLLNSIETLLPQYEGQPEKTSKPELSLPQIALLCVYQARQITNENCKEIAKEFGFESESSGKNLASNYKNLRDSEQRVLATGTKGDTQRTIDFNSVIVRLDGLNRKRAEDDFEKLKINIEKQTFTK